MSPDDTGARQRAGSNRRAGIGQRDYVALAALTSLGLLIYRDLVLGGRVLTSFDALVYFYPNIEFSVRSLLSGRLPLWNPYLFTGVPFLANSQAGVLYPFNWPFWLLSPPTGYTLNAFAHALFAAAGGYVAGRTILGIRAVPAAAGAAAFAFGGFFTAQIGHLNQLQAAAWLPWLTALAWRSVHGERLRWPAVTGIALAMQVLAGHSQVVYLTCALLAIVWVAGSVEILRPACRIGARAAISVTAQLVGRAAVIGTLALGIAATQLLPTLELTREGIRSQGLTFRDAAAFSLPPWDALVTLLPTIDGPRVSSEWVGYVGVTGLLLAAFALCCGARRSVLPALVATGGLLLAFGQYLPTYQPLFDFVPGFALYRVPARWLLLYTAGAAALVGLGLDRLGQCGAVPERPRLPTIARVGIVSLAGVGALGVAESARRSLAALGIDPPLPGPWSAALWAVAGATALALVARAYSWAGRAQPDTEGRVAVARVALFGLLACELAIGASRLDVARGNLFAAAATVPESAKYLASAPGPQRVLSFSDNAFERGDVEQLRARYASVLTADELRELSIALKYGETLTPNLPLRYGIQSLDGYDGGLLPLTTYAGVKSLFPLEGEDVSDGRLRLRLVRPPNPDLLAWLSVSHVLMDRRRDIWHDGVYFDTAFDRDVNAGDSIALSVPGTKATAVGVVAFSESPAESALVDIRVTDTHGTESTCRAAVDPRPILGAGDAWPEPRPSDARWCALPNPGPVARIELGATDHRIIIRSVSLAGPPDEINQVVPIQTRLKLVYLGDVKIYEQTSSVSRAWLPTRVTLAASDADALALMQARGFDGRREAVVVASDWGDGPLSEGTEPASATVTLYEPERVQISVNAPEPRLLVVTDSWYPGWQATVNGAPARIVRVDHAFRGVLVPAGDSTVEMVYRPSAFYSGAAISALALAAAIGLIILAGRRKSPVLE